MYDVNFIKHRIVPEGRKKVIATIIYVSTLFLGLCILGMGSVAVSDFQATQVYAGEIVRIRSDLETRYPGIPASQGELESMVKITEPHLRELGKLVEARIAFAPIWERIAACVPENVWLTRVALADPRNTGGEDLRGRGNHGGAHNLFRGVTIEGVALAGSGPEGDLAVSTFVESLENDTELQEYIRGVEFMGTGLKQVDGTSVVGFEITCPF